MKLKTKNINGVLFNKNLYPALFVFFFIFSGGSASVAQAAFCKGPADVVLAIDRSANMERGAKFDTVKSSSVDFIDNLFAIPPHSYPLYYHQIGLAIFNNNITSEPLTTDYAYIQDVISSLGVPNSSCKAWEAIMKAQANLKTYGNGESTKTIIILIAGPPDDTDLAIEQVRVATESEIGTRVIAVGINLDQLADSQKKADAERFITNDYINSYDCYYASDNPDAALDGCISISTDDLNNSLNAVYSDITRAVCDEIAPELEIHRIPSGTLYNIDKLKITSIATDDIGFKSHLIVWSDNWPSDQQRTTNCSLVGKTISCDTGELGPFAVGKTVNFGSSATDANDNVITIDPLYNFVRVATVSLSVPALLRNKNNIISVNISDPEGKANLDEFYIRIDNDGIKRINEASPSSKMSCSGTGSNYNCTYNFNPDCASAGIYPANAVDIYIYAKSGIDYHPSPIAYQLNKALGLPNEGVYWRNCSNGIDDDCDGIIDLAEISCDSESPAVVIARTSPVETSEVYDDDTFITLKSDATDSSGIKRNTIYYKKVGSSEWTFDCNDANVDGKCDEDATQSVASISAVISSIFPVSAGTEVQYYSQAIDYSGNNNTGSSLVKFFIVKSRECDGVSDLGACNVTPGGKCCGGVCNATIVNPGGYNTESCAKEICNGISWRWGIDISKNNTICSESENSDNCYSYLPPGYFWDGGCEERVYRCSSGYCAYGVVNRNRDYCIGGGSLILNDYECVGNSCALSPDPPVENDICDLNLDYLTVNSYNSDNDLICGFLDGVNGEVLDSKTNQISLISDVTDINGISEHEIYWQKNSEAWGKENCGTCPDGNTCSCDKEIGPYNVGDVIKFYAKAKDNSPNHTSRTTTTYSFTVRDSDCYDIPPGGNKTDLTTFCGPGDNTNGRCCGGSCDTSLSNPSSYDDECSKEACIATSWEKDYDGAKEGLVCGGSDTCFGYYTGCKDGGNKCSAGYCEPAFSGTFIASCSENNYTTFGCIPDQFGSCQSIDVNVDCSAAGVYDGDSVSCNCDCNGYDVEEKFGSSLSFDGVDDYVDFGDVLDVNANYFSVEMWFKWNGKAGSNILFNKENLYEAQVSSGYLTYAWQPSRAWYGGTSFPVNAGEWYHVAIVYDKNKQYVYKNGNPTPVYSRAQTGDIGSNSSKLLIGARGSGAPYDYFGGSIDEARVYNRALYPEEITDHYNGVYSNNSGLAGYWNFNEVSGEIVNDNSGGGKNGIFSNFDYVLGSSPKNPQFNSADKKYGSYLLFDGNDDYAIKKLFYIPRKDISVEFWMKTSNISKYGTPFSYAVSGNENEFLIYDYNNFSIHVKGAPIASGISANDGLWHHIIVTRKSIDGKIKVYKDGGVSIYEGTLGTADIVTGGALVLGQEQDSVGGSFDITQAFLGSLDEVRVYNRVLSDAEAQEHYKGVFVDNSGLVGYWNFNSDAKDVSNNGPTRMRSFDDSNKNNVPVVGQVCTDIKDNDCDSVTDEYEIGGAQCDGEVENVFIQATAVDRNNVERIISKPTVEIYDIDVSQDINNFTLLAMSGDAFGILQTLIEWTIDNWGTTNNVACDNTGVCEACVVGGTCDNDIINPSFLVADNVFTYRVCAWDNNNNKACSEDYSFVVLSSNLAPWLSDLEVIVPDFCEKGLEYILSWKFNDDDIFDEQSYYEVQVKEGNNDWTTGPLAVDLLKYVSANNASFSYHPIINGENLEYGEKEYYWRVRATDNKTGGYAKTSEWAEGEVFITPAYKFPRVEFSANLSSDPDKDCFSEICNFGEDIVFHDNTTYFASCNNSDSEQCLSTDAAKCNVSEGQCVSCSDNFECSKFNSDPSINYSCVAGICRASGSCASDGDCKSADAAKCDIESGECVICDDDSQCAQFKDSDDAGYICNAGKCEFPSHRTWDFYGYDAISSADPDPINNYVESVFDNYDVLLKITDITGEYCSEFMNIKLGGKLYPEWNEVSSSN